MNTNGNLIRQFNSFNEIIKEIKTEKAFGFNWIINSK